MYHILIIDDDEQIRRICRTVLELEGYEVEDAPDGVVGLEKFDERPSDIVLCDIFMPRQDGLETIRIELALVDAGVMEEAAASAEASFSSKPAEEKP